MIGHGHRAVWSMCDLVFRSTYFSSVLFVIMDGLYELSAVITGLTQDGRIMLLLLCESSEWPV